MNKQPLSRRTLLSGMGILALSGASTAFAQTEKKETKVPDDLFFLFFTKGANREARAKETPEAIEKMQAAHLANMTRLAGEGKCLMAGPIGKNDQLRGIVVLTAKDLDDLKASFTEDPFVQKGYLGIEAHPWRAEKSLFHKVKEPYELGEYTIGIIQKGPKWEPFKGEVQANTLEETMPALKTLKQKGTLAFSGPFADTGERVGVLLFFSNDIPTLKAALDEDPTVKAGRVTVELYPQWHAKGTLGDK